LVLIAAVFLGGCATLPTPQSSIAPVHLPAPPTFMGACKPSGVKVGDQPNQAFDLEHAALKQCSRNGEATRHWYLRLRTFYGK
jgi:hypothetical protein